MRALNLRSACVAAVVGALAAGSSLAQRQVRKGSSATFMFDEFEYDINTGTTVMKGNCEAQIAGDYQAHMTASAIVVKPNKERSRVDSFEATGPVKFNVTLTTDEGVTTKIVASSTQKATFNGQTMIAELIGDARADISGVPGAEDLETLKYEGPRVKIDLKKKTVSCDQPRSRLEAELAPSVLEGEAESKEPE